MDLATETLMAESLTWISTVGTAIAFILQNQPRGSSTTPLIAAITAGGVVGAAISGSIIKARQETKSKDKDLKIAELTGEKDVLIAELKVPQELQIEYDKDLRDRRIQHYGKLWSLMLPLAKYPDPGPLSYDRARELSESLRRWYFGRGGLFLTQKTRDKYFDLQDGLKIVAQKVAQKREERWPRELDDKARELDIHNIARELARIEDIKNREELERYKQYQGHLRERLDWDENWKAPPPLVRIGSSQLDTSANHVPVEVHADLRRLGSSLRTSLTEDVLTRKDPYTGDNVSVKGGAMDLDEILGAISAMSEPELARVREAVASRREQLAQSKPL